MAHGGALPADGAVSDGRHGAAAGVPVHALAVRDRAGGDPADLPPGHPRPRAVRPPTSQCSSSYLPGSLTGNRLRRPDNDASQPSMRLGP